MVAINTEDKVYTLEEYIALEEKSIEKHEFHQGKLITMAGGTLEHNTITVNIGSAIKVASKTAKKKCRVLSSDMKIWISTIEKAVYPDVAVVCEQPQFHQGRHIINNPLLVVEVLSNSTEAYDRGNKFEHFRSISSFKEYVLIDQYKAKVEVWFRTTQNTWEVSVVQDLEAKVTLQSLGFTIALEDIYDLVDF